MNKREIDNALKKISQGDNNAFEKLYIETKCGVYAFLFSYLNNRADSEDAMQTVYLKIKTSINQYKIGSNGLAWILQIAKNTALNMLRKQSNYEKKLTDINYKENNFYENIEKKDIIMKIMQQALNEEERQIIILHVIWGYKHKEIAKILNCPTGTITSKYKRAVDKLKKAYKEE